MDKAKKHRFLVNLLLIFSVFFVSVTCTIEAAWIDPYYITGTKEEQAKFRELFNLLRLEEKGTEDEFAVIREIAASYARLGDYDRLIHFLSGETIGNQANPYNAFYNLMIAYAYMQQGSKPIAMLYFDLIIKNYPDLIINDESIHLVCLRNLIDLNEDPGRLVRYYNEMINNFSDKIDLGPAYFMLGQICEQVGDWNGAIAAYANYLPFAGTIIPGYPNSEQYAKQQVDFSKSAKDWTFESLPRLRAAVESALEDNDPYRLMQYQAKVNFFARSWEQMDVENIRMTAFNLAQFMYGNKIRYEKNLDASSNATEAFLRTTGWSISLNTWYLYFRKINFPQDPEIHGRWEWAGIYYGEKF
ncbi:MAG: tetratricopeptide repeat protein [Treponema sp.]|nr:tetratricopeptide repeat protein [Treponema sp.]MCL2237030.1 tetratricopeptide repeat protein [Treponema sp.]